MKTAGKYGYKPPVDECPHCKSKEGFEYTYVNKHVQWMGFDGQGIWNDVIKTYGESKKRCIDCKKIIKEIL